MANSKLGENLEEDHGEKIRDKKIEAYNMLRQINLLASKAQEIKQRLTAIENEIFELEKIG